MKEYEDSAWLQTTYEKLGTLDAVAGAAGCSDETIRRWMDIHKLDRERRAPLKQDIRSKLDNKKWLTERYDILGTIRGVARSLGVSDPTVLRAMRKYGIPTRKPTYPSQISAAGYRLIHNPGFPGTTKYGYALEHRVIMAEHLGRDLLPTEHVHHINADKADNRLENLVLLQHTEHRTHHNGFHTPTMDQGEKIELMRKKGMLAGEIAPIVGLCSTTVSRYLEEYVKPVCGLCGREFKNQKGVSVHVNRTHRMRY